MMNILLVSVIAFIGATFLAPSVLGMVGIAPSAGVGMDDVIVGLIVGLLVYFGLQII